MDYLLLERSSPERHELGVALGGKACRVCTSDVRVRIRDTGLTTYPDVSVVCGRPETDSEDADAIVNPVVLIEVLSDSSEAHDRGAKTAHYRRIQSLREYVLVSQSEPAVEVYRRNVEGRFELDECGADDTVELASVGVSLAVRALYANPLAAG